MSKKSVKMQSWQVFHFARKHLGSPVINVIFGKKNARKIDYWCQDPKYTNKQEGSYDPILGVKKLLEILDDHGHEDIVRSTVSYITADTSAASSSIEPGLADLQPTISEEILRDYKVVADLQSAIENSESIEVVDGLKEEAMDEIARTVALYRKNMGVMYG